jgi:hypothetical protein
VDNPPLDVWLIWHAYMLNPTYDRRLSFCDWVSTRHCAPRWYAEDLERVRVLAELKNLPVSPLELLVRSENMLASVPG